MQAPLWFQILVGALAPTIAIVGLVIAGLQWRIAHNKLRFDLFEKRVEVLRSTQFVFAHILYKGRRVDGQLNEHLARLSEGPFLFDAKIGSLCKQVFERAIVFLRSSPDSSEEEDALDFFVENFATLTEQFGDTLQISYR